MKKFYFLFSILSILAVLALTPSCTKEGPAGKDGVDGADGANGANGADGANGQDGADGTAGCIECHAADVVDLISTQFQLSKHEYGEAAFEEAGSTTCGPCHLQEAFKYVVENNVPSTFTLNPATNKYVNDYFCANTAAYGEIGCSSCHSSLHTTYTTADGALTTVAPVAMTMWGGAKTIDCPADGKTSNLCIKCHQPRPLTKSGSAGDNNVLDYAGLASNPTAMFYDPDGGTPTILRPGYRTHVHYGAVGAVFAGMGGVEFGSGYVNSIHTAGASCQDCHMAEMTGAAGGHTFKSKGNFKGCNVEGCHAAAPIDATSPDYWVEPRAEIKAKLDALAALLQIGGVDILNRGLDTEANLWYSNTTNHYDGYLNIYDPINNPDGPANNPAQFQNPAPSNSWTQEQKDHNLTLPKITLTNAQMGAIINFQLCLRDYSLGIHNFKYTKNLLANSMAVLN